MACVLGPRVLELAKEWIMEWSANPYGEGSHSAPPRGCQQLAEWYGMRL